MQKKSIASGFRKFHRAAKNVIPTHVLDVHKKRLADWQAKRDHVRAVLEALGA